MKDFIVLYPKDRGKFMDFVYNLVLVAPTKGEAKKTVSEGKIRLWVSDRTLYGLASDDILSVLAQVELSGISQIGGWVSGFGRNDPVWVTVDDLKMVALANENTFVLNCEYLDSDASLEFDQKFWVDHVLDSIEGPLGRWPVVTEVMLSPDRLRKFSLMKPQGHPLQWEFIEWADRDIIRFSYQDLKGIYVPLDAV